MYREFRYRYRNSWQGNPVNKFISMKKYQGNFFPCAFHWESESENLTLILKIKFVHCFSLPGIPVPVSKIPVHVPVPNKYARIPVPAKIPGTGCAQPLNHICLSLNNVQASGCCDDPHCDLNITPHGYDSWLNVVLHKVSFVGKMSFVPRTGSCHVNKLAKFCSTLNTHGP